MRKKKIKQGENELLDVRNYNKRPIKKDRVQEIKKECLTLIQERFENEIEYLDLEYFLREKKSREFSPIEKMFIYKFVARYIIGDEWKLFDNDGRLSGTHIVLVYSPKVLGKSGKFYYPDFGFKVYRGYTLLYDFNNLYIELDGHIWHERTPEQVEKDKHRERDLQDNGVRLYRFTGREVHRNPDIVIDKCLEAYVGGFLNE